MYQDKKKPKKTLLRRPFQDLALFQKRATSKNFPLAVKAPSQYALGREQEGENPPCQVNTSSFLILPRYAQSGTTTIY